MTSPRTHTLIWPYVLIALVIFAYHWLLAVAACIALVWAWRAGRRRQRAVTLRRLR